MTRVPSPLYCLSHHFPTLKQTIQSNTDTVLDTVVIATLNSLSSVFTFCTCIFVHSTRCFYKRKKKKTPQSSSSSSTSRDEKFQTITYSRQHRRGKVRSSRLCYSRSLKKRKFCDCQSLNTDSSASQHGQPLLHRRGTGPDLHMRLNPLL